MNLKSPILSIGFRPFFLLAAAGAFVLLGLWVLFFLGHLNLSLVFDPITWHAHEMIFGVASAVLFGFLLTASQNWSGVRGVHGKRLLLIILLWVLGRLGGFFHMMSFLELTLVPVFIILISPYLWIKEKPRNKKILIMLFVFWLADLLIHMGYVQLGRNLGIDILIGFLLLISGRIIPPFSAKVFQRAQVSNIGGLEVLSTILFLLFMMSPFIGSHDLRWISAGALSVAHGIRWARWSPLRSLKTPILSILYMGYLWIIIGFLIVALSDVLAVPQSLSIHFFTVGALGVFFMGMMTRVGLGHTGRPIQANYRVLISYTSINLAVITRALLPIFFPGEIMLFIKISGVLWCLAFGLFFLEFFKILIYPRPDLEA